VLAGVLLVATRAQVHLWRDNLTLFQHALAVTTRNHVAHYMVAGELAKLGQRREAMAHYAAAVEFRPNWANARNNYAVLLEEHGMVDDAIEQYREAIRVDPRYAKAHDNLGALLVAKQRYAEAAAHFEAALRIDPSLASAHRHLGLLLLRAGQPEQARDHLLRATQGGGARLGVAGALGRKSGAPPDSAK
jgi:tetratricopeptide (TPR) repeat protein